MPASRPAGDHHGRLVGAAGGEEARRLPADLMGLADRLRAGARRHRIDHEDVGLGVGQRQHLGIDGGIGDLEARGHRDRLVGVGAERFLDAAEIFLAGVVVLVEHREARIRVLGAGIGDVDRGLAGVVRRPGQRHRPRHVGGIVPLRGRADQKQLRHLVAVEIFCDRRARRRAHGREDEGDAVALDQPPRRFHGLRRRERVVERQQIELAAVDAALLVDLFEIGREHPAGDAERRRRPAIGHGVADLDLGVADAGTVGFLRGDRRGQTGGSQRCGQDQSGFHGFSPVIIVRASATARRAAFCQHVRSAEFRKMVLRRVADGLAAPLQAKPRLTQPAPAMIRSMPRNRPRM